MEQSLAADQSTAPPSLFATLASSQGFSFHLPTQQQSLPAAVQVLAPPLSAGAIPIPSFSFAHPTMSQATLSSPPTVRFQPNSSLSPDPPGTTTTLPSISVASMPATSRLRAQVSARASARRQQASAATSAAPSTRYATRRAATGSAAPAAAAVAPVAAAASSSTSSTDAVIQPRRSQRNRKRTTMREETTRDPPTKKQKRGNLKRAPGRLKSDDADEKSEEAAETTASCCICMDQPSAADLASINGCDHLFCFDCIEKWAERENTCPLCKVRFTKIDRVNKAKRKKGESSRNTKKVKQKDQRSDIAPGAALEGLLASFASSANFPPHRVARLIFSGMGGNPFAAVLPGSSALRSSRAAGAAAAERANAVEDSLFSDDTDDDEDHSFLPAVPSGHPAALAAAANPLADLFRTFPGTVGSRGIVIGSSLGGRGGLSSTTFDPPPGRSYATNSGDRNAGRQAENPLEIEDDSEDEEDIEVVQVTRRL